MPVSEVLRIATGITRGLGHSHAAPSCGYQTWLSFARAFCGAVEQQILGMPALEPSRRAAASGAVPLLHLSRLVSEVLP